MNPEDRREQDRTSLALIRYGYAGDLDSWKNLVAGTEDVPGLLAGLTRMGVLFSKLLAEAQGVDYDQVMEETALYLASRDAPNEDQPDHGE
jgi:hypothetical protein